MPPGSGARLRAAAALAVTEVAENRRSLDAALARQEARLPAAGSARGQLRAICYGTLRFYPRLSYWLDGLVSRPIRKRDAVVRSLLLTGIYQLDAMRIAPHAVVAESVNAARLLRQSRASGMVNAVLRRFQREAVELRTAASDASSTQEAQFAHPGWLVDRFRADWPEDWASLVAANNAHPPFWVRLNPRAMSRQTFEERLAESGNAVEAAGPHDSHALRLKQAVDVKELPGFSDGAVTVQDAAAQIAAPLLDARDGHRVLDACAAPGGKSGHILERAGGVELTALDSDERRLGRVSETMERLGLSCTTLAGRAERPADWWDGRPFDRILVDAPCSGTGVIRRHPDIKLLRQPADVPQLAALQLDMLEALWPLVAPGGRMVYATCSVLQAENAGVIGAFLQRFPDARAHWPAGVGPVGQEGGGGRQILTGEADLDGFYYSCMEKTP